MIGLYRRRNNNTVDATLEFEEPPVTMSTIAGLQQTQVTALQDEIEELKKELSAYKVSPFLHPLYVKCVHCHILDVYVCRVCLYGNVLVSCPVHMKCVLCVHASSLPSVHVCVCMSVGHCTGVCGINHRRLSVPSFLIAGEDFKQC